MKLTHPFTFQKSTDFSHRATRMKDLRRLDRSSGQCCATCSADIDRWANEGGAYDWQGCYLHSATPAMA